MTQKVIVCFTKLVQRIFKHGDIENTSHTADKELNITIYAVSFFTIIYRNTGVT